MERCGQTSETALTRPSSPASRNSARRLPSAVTPTGFPSSFTSSLRATAYQKFFRYARRPRSSLARRPSGLEGSRAPGARPKRLRRSARVEEEEEDEEVSPSRAAAAASASASSSSVPSRLRSSCFSLGRKVFGFFFCSGGRSEEGPPPGISTAPGMGEGAFVFGFGASSTAVAESDVVAAVAAFSASSVVRGEEELEEEEELFDSSELLASDEAAASLFCWSAGARRSGNIFLPSVTCLRTSRSCFFF